MALSPNYSWSEPDNSSLVKNGAADIRTLGDAIDASLWNSGFGQAGKNKIINGDFGIWQRGTTFTNAVGPYYSADRWRVGHTTADPTSASLTQQTFTPATAPVAGYEGTFFLRYTLTTKGSNTAVGITNRIENVRTFAGQTATFSFWAKADSARTTTISLGQFFGTGGSATVTVGSDSLNLTTAWQRFTFTYAVPTISGKTIGAGSFVFAGINVPSTDGTVLDLWGFQMEYGSKATPFQLAGGGDPQSELAMCQRYYYRTGGDTATQAVASGKAISTTNAYPNITFPVTMRSAPTALDFSTMGLRFDAGSGATAATSLSLFNAYKNGSGVTTVVASGLVAATIYDLVTNNSTSGYVGFSAEL